MKVETDNSYKFNKCLDIADFIYQPFFADRETIAEAIHYAMDIGKASDNPAAVTTAVFVVLNTIAKQIRELENGK